MSLFIDSSNTLWIGTTYGLNQFDYEKEIFTRHFHDPADNNSISSNFINSIFQDSSGTLWIGTDGGGLNKMIPGSKKGAPPRFINYTVKNGLPNNVVLDILQDDQGNLWLSTNNGLSRFSLKDTTFRNYNITDGLQDNEFNDGAAFKSKSGELFFGGDNGVNIFYPENLKDNRYIPPIVITDFQIFNQSVPVGEWSDGISILEETITETKRITLSNKYNIFSFQFSALNYISTEKNQYAYKMEGLEKNWNYVGDRRFVTYTTLPPGDYVFSVKGSNNNGFWNEEGTHLKIRITPPFWQTWWFRILVITIILALIVVFYRIRTFHIKQTNIQLEEKNILLNKQIQERKKVEEALKESEAKYRSLFINIPDPILIFHRETNQILDCNQAALDRYGYTLEELQSIGPDDLRPYDELKKEVPDTEIKGDNPYLYSHITKTGERLEVQVHTAPVEYKKQMAYISIIRDITQQKQLEQQLYQAQKMESIGNLAGGIAHDFNNLLTAIIGHAELALMKMEKESPFISDINAVLTSGKRASDLTGQLLAFSRKQIIKPRIIDINSLILDLDTMLHRLIGEDISIKKTLKPDIMRIKADPGQIEQILVNIIINACDAINEQTYKAIDKKITIETNQVYLDESYTQELIEITPGQYISIAVSDTGTGMSKKTKGQIFDPFFTTKKEGKGTGLGLSTVYGIVKQNRGNIYVYSEPGKGSTIKIYWPATVEQETIDTIEKTDKKSFTGSETILFVEDDKGVRDFGVAALKELGYNVFEAQTGRRAITLIKEKKLSFDLLITDLVMPEMNGKELADTIKSMFPDVKVLYTSGYTDNHIVHRGELAEGVHFLQKPYSIKSLLSMIRNIFDHPES